MDSLEVCVLLCDSGLVEEKWEELGEFRDVVSMICNGNLTQAYEWIQSQHVFNLEDFKNTKNIEGKIFNMTLIFFSRSLRDLGVTCFKIISN